MPEQRSICLIPIPFTDLKSQKKRPVLILSNNVYNQKTDDVLVMALTSNLNGKEFSIDVTGEDMETGELKKKSIIRIDKIYSISQALIIKSFGKINNEKFNLVVKRLNDFISQS